MDLWGLYVSALNVKVSEEKNKKQSKTKDNDEFDDYSSSLSHDSTVESSSDEDTTSATTSTHRRKAYRSDVQELKKYPPLLISPLFSYLGILILRLPITLVDIFSYFLMHERDLYLLDGLNPKRYHIYRQSSLFQLKCLNDCVGIPTPALQLTYCFQLKILSLDKIRTKIITLLDSSAHGVLSSGIQLNVTAS
jgi:hypothetical protein